VRAAPPFAFTVRRFGAWRAALVALGLAGSAATTLWWRATDLPARQAAALAVAGFACALLPLVEACRLRPAALRWDGARWQLECMPDALQGAPRVGRLFVATALGGWLLLRFDAEPPRRATVGNALRRGRTPAWIAVQRRGLEADWHAIRCTVYSPPPQDRREALRPD